MSSNGTFRAVHAQAAKIHFDETDCPMHPVVRHECGQWQIESQLDPADCDFEICLHDFCDYWFADSCRGESPNDFEIQYFLDVVMDC